MIRFRQHRVCLTVVALWLAACSSSSSSSTGGLGPECTTYTAPNGCCEQAGKGEATALAACAQFATEAQGASASELTALEASCEEAMSAAQAAGLCGSTTPDAGSPRTDGGFVSPMLTPCAELGDCCKELSGDEQTVCSQAVAVGDSSTCATELLTVAMAGNCQNVSPAGVCLGADVVCNGGCVDLKTDAANCGGCGHVCPSSPGVGTGICSDGQCAYACDGSATYCNGACVDTTTDPSNCGSCGSDCSAKLAAALSGVTGNAGMGTSSASCVAGVCQAQLNDEEVDCNLNDDTNCSAMTCDALCMQALKVPCDPAGSLEESCPGTEAGCGFYYGSDASCYPQLSCGETPPSTVPCEGETATLSLFECACSGSFALP